MKESITLNILERIKQNNAFAKDLLKEFLLGKLTIDRIIDKAFSYDEMKKHFSENEWKRYSNNFYVTLKRLEQDNLIDKKRVKEGVIIKITEKGIEKIKALKEKQKNALPSYKYKKEKSNRATIIIFDIPETEKRKRDWLRIAILNLGFKMVQKSVWIGNVKIPEDFLLSLKHLNILKYVEIFQVTKQGTLESLK